MIIVVRSVFHEGNKYYPKVFLDECFENYKLMYLKEWMLTKPMVLASTIGHYWYFLKTNFRFQPKVCNGCHDLMQKVLLILQLLLLQEMIRELNFGTQVRMKP